MIIDYGAESLSAAQAGTRAHKDGEGADDKGDGAQKPLSSPKEEQASKKKKPKPEMSPDTVYSANKSISGHTANNIAFPLSYGSADLQGFKFIDTVCLNPLKYHSAEAVTDAALK